MRQKNIYKKRRSRKWDSKGVINPLAGGVLGGQSPPDKSESKSESAEGGAE